ncbi:APC family permease [Natronomonas marina]|jgi:APA family basic amino acid/polyamine antiporter|uniref:APC family permease n=1 Tax=Natronomonas marina TaxID=2961939 RepID=UPI0020C9C785|nr:APC family permease [Natronomonas marina]
MSGESLEGDIGLFEAVAIQVGIVVGAGLFAVTGVAVAEAGPGVAVSYVVAVVAVSLSLVPTAVLGAMYPTVGGNYRYPSRLWSPRIAFLTTWGMAVSVLGGGLPLYGLSFGQYLDSLVAVDPRLTGAAVVTLFFVVNLVGIEPAARVQQLMLVTLAASLVAFVVVGAPAVDPANLDPAFPSGIGGVLVGGALLYFVCMGANFIVDVGGEMRDAALTIPRSFFVSIPLILVVYVLTSLVAVGSVGWQALANEPLSVAAEAALPPALETAFTVGGALFAIATTINAVYMIAPKYLLVLADDGVFPSAFGDVNDRFGTPHWGLTFVYVVSLAFLLSPLSIERFSTLMAFGSIVLVMPVMVAAVLLVRNRADAYADAPFRIAPRTLVAVSVVAVVLNLGLLALLASEEPRTFAVWAGLVAVGGGYYLLRARQAAANGAPLPDRMDDL